MADGRGLPLLSGPPPSPRTDRAEIACRKCNKEFNLIFTRSRKCNHCGYSYCSSCADYQALMPRSGPQGAGYDVMSVCAYCIDHLNSTWACTSAARARQPTLLRFTSHRGAA
ncbi:hypothetical protein PLICRDRAFT_641825 [Plicaturopsis crispa FD-325 SS-3]|nr:hypothetical protein PLICRDRAFT_641825 [Plicaturopsis crispa FD-325 SS-3]